MSMDLTQVFDFVVSVFNFAIMFILFRLVVILPMKEAVRLREQRVALRLKEIEEAVREAAEMRAKFEARFGDVESVLSEIKENADRSLSHTKARLQEKADAEETYVMDKAKAEADSLRREAEAKVRTQVAARAVARAEEILASALDASAQNKIMTAAVKKMGELSAS